MQQVKLQFVRRKRETANDPEPDLSFVRYLTLYFEKSQNPLLMYSANVKDSKTFVR